MKFQFTIMGRLRSRNENESAARSHWAIAAKERKKELEWCMASIRLADGYQDSRFSNAVGVSFDFYEPNGKRDPDNIIAGQKVILDALVRLAVLANDTHKQIKSLGPYKFFLDKENPRIVVTLED